MKLYLTARNKKTSKGIGDDTMIVIDLNQGNTRVATLKFTTKPDPYTMDNPSEVPKLEIMRDEEWTEIYL